MPNERWTIKTADGEFGAYVAKPEGAGPWPAVVVIQEIFGINFVVRDVADGLARDGYLAVAPDLFWRIEPGIDITDGTEAELGLAFGYYKAFDVSKGMDDIAATFAEVRARPDCNGKVGAEGHCLGGLLAYLTAARTNSDATVSYYGVGIEGFLAEVPAIRRPLLLHIAGEDMFVPKAAQADIVAGVAANPNIEVHVYPGREHAFARINGRHFDGDDAALANARTASFFKSHLG